tara:strand:- start:2195 stop:2983 length:789 start_codon:yes stop_codon:yes gene_type:complete
MARLDKGIVRRAIVTPDKHFPLHDDKAISVVCQAIEIVKPDTYIDLGDTGEWELFSKHYWKDKEKPPLEVLMPMLDKEVALVNEGMDLIDASLDKAKCKKRHFIQGNHELWLDNFVTRHPYLPQYKTENALRIKERGYKYLKYISNKPLKIGKLNFIHGKYTPIHHAKKHLEKGGQSVIYGHTHDFQRFTDTKWGGTISAWSMGCLKDMSSEANEWLRGNLHNWNHGFAIVDWFQGGNFKVEVVEIIDGKTSLWGKLIDGNK